MTDERAIIKLGPRPKNWCRQFARKVSIYDSLERTVKKSVNFILN